eukprot:scaffold129613_cov30-Tisochrysis_lutea.AAC.1
MSLPAHTPRAPNRGRADAPLSAGANATLASGSALRTASYHTLLRSAGRSRCMRVPGSTPSLNTRVPPRNVFSVGLLRKDNFFLTHTPPGKQAPQAAGQRLNEGAAHPQR